MNFQNLIFIPALQEELKGIFEGFQLKHSKWNFELLQSISKVYFSQKRLLQAKGNCDNDRRQKVKGSNFELLTASRRILIISSPGISSMSKPGFQGQPTTMMSLREMHHFMFVPAVSCPWKPDQKSLNRVFQTLYFAVKSLFL